MPPAALKTDKALIESTVLPQCEVGDLGLALSWPQFPHLLNGQSDLDGV